MQPRSLDSGFTESFTRELHAIQDEFGLPILMIEADMVDERSFSESQIETRIDAFMEMIKEKKG